MRVECNLKQLNKVTLMKRIIWQQLDTRGVTELDIPQGAKVLSCVFEEGAIAIFIEVDSSAKHVKRSFKTITTGGDAPSGAWRFVGSVQQRETDWGSTMYHIYELPEKTERNLDELVSRMKESRNVVESPKSSPVDIAKNAFSMGWWCLEEGFETCDTIKADEILDAKMKPKKVSLNLKKRDLDGPYPSPR